MKNKDDIVRKIMKFCPYDWAKDKEDVSRTLGYWLNEDKWVWDDKHLGGQTGGFRFMKTKSGHRYIETIPTRIYID